MPTEDTWPPSLPAPPLPPPKRPFVWPSPSVVLLALAASLWDGWRDIHHAGPVDPFGISIWGVVISLSLAALQPRFAWLWALMQTAGMTAVHVLAIAHGYGPPYVETDAFGAILGGFFYIVPCLFLAYLAVGLRALLRLLVRDPDHFLGEYESDHWGQRPPPADR